MIQNDYERLRNRCLYLIAKMPRTEKDLRKKIEYGKYKYSKEVIDQVINNLKEYNYIDDYAYTKRFIELNIKNNSKKILEQKLFIKGVNQNIIKELLFEIDEEEEINVCKKILLKKYYDYYNIKNDLEYKERAKIFSYLYRKGFSQDIIERVLNN